MNEGKTKLWLIEIQGKRVIAINHNDGQHLLNQKNLIDNSRMICPIYLREATPEEERGIV